MKFKNLLIILLVVIFAACGKKVEDKKVEKKYETVDLVLDWYPTSSSTPIYVALEKGYYEEEGIKLNIHMPSGTSDPLALVAAKKVDLGYYYIHRTIMSIVNDGIPVKAIASTLQGSVSTVMSLKENNITRPKDLEGKTLGYCGGPLSEKMIDAMMRADGGDPSKVKLVDVGFELLSSLITKKVDATLGGLVTHEVPLMEEKGYQVNYFFPKDFGVPEYPETLIIANKDLISEREEVYTKFLKATRRGFEDVKANPEEAVQILLANQAKDQFPLNENVERVATKRYIPIMEKFGPFLTIDEDVFQENVDWLYEKGFINKKENLENFYKNLIN
ncbi:ABC transporter substrate-binding protein [Fusobacterium sp. MFO224]|uniref:ABC transporter substrate-binding protein n=1 Tax=Fusobacterium sp. MFO224 TaxID=3378070 RepID=UPI003852A6E4